MSSLHIMYPKMQLKLYLFIHYYTINAVEVASKSNFFKPLPSISCEVVLYLYNLEFCET